MRVRAALITIAAGGMLAAGVAMAGPAVASPAARTAPVHQAAKATLPPSNGYCVVNGYGWYIAANGAGKELISDASCATTIAWREQSNGSYEMALDNGTSCANVGSNGFAYDNSCVDNDSTEEFLVAVAGSGYSLENVHYAKILWTTGAGTGLSLTSAAPNPESEWTW